MLHDLRAEGSDLNSPLDTDAPWRVRTEHRRIGSVAGGGTAVLGGLLIFHSPHDGDESERCETAGVR